MSNSRRALDALDVVFPLVTGLAVVVITLIADRVGGRLGGVLATAPVTTTVAHIVIATSVPPDQAAARVLQGIAALMAGTFAIVAFFYAIKYSRGRSSNARLAAGLGAHVAVFLPLTLLFAQAGLPPVTGFVILFGVHGALAFSFMREPVPILQAPRRASRGPLELVARFSAGALVVIAIRALVHYSPPLAGALAVVPAVFLVSLTVMGVTNNAPFAARAAQAGLFGTTAVAVFVLVIAGVLALGVSVWWAILPAWGAYAGTLTVLSFLHRRMAP